MGLANHRLLTRAALAAAVLIVPLSARAQTNYAAEAARNPGAASKPTPHTADGHPDLNGVWHHFFGIGTIQKVGDSFADRTSAPDCAHVEAGGVSIRRQHGESVACDSAGRARAQHGSRDGVNA